MTTKQHTYEPFGFFKAEPFGWTDCSETDEGAIPLYEQKTIDDLVVRLEDIERHPLIAYDTKNNAVSNMSDQSKGWINPNDKTQKQYLPHIGEQVLFCHKGKIYIGKHTGGSFKAMTPPFALFGTWDCHWMYPPIPIKD